MLARFKYNQVLDLHLYPLSVKNDRIFFCLAFALMLS